MSLRQGAYLPHWSLASGGIYAVTYRLADSLPRETVEWLTRERNALAIERFRGQEGLDPDGQYAERIEDALSVGTGTCWLRDPAVAACVADNLRHFAGERYRLHAWCVMPNHVHVLVEPLDGRQLRELVHSWKSYTAKAANRLLERTGEFWQAEYYDHLIRDVADYQHAVRYIEQNPVKAGLRDWPWVSRRVTYDLRPSEPDR